MTTTILPTKIPMWSSNSRPTTNSAGAIRFNTTIQSMEFYDGQVWMPFNKTDPETWQQWFEYYITASGSIPDLYTKQVYIQQEMKGRFPGNYQIDLSGHDWVMVFDNPRDETWFNLKYS
jgi:hypothetical protein